MGFSFALAATPSDETSRSALLPPAPSAPSTTSTPSASAGNESPSAGQPAATLFATTTGQRLMEQAAATARHSSPDGPQTGLTLREHGANLAATVAEAGLAARAEALTFWNDYRVQRQGKAALNAPQDMQSALGEVLDRHAAPFAHEPGLVRDFARQISATGVLLMEQSRAYSLEQSVNYRAATLRAQREAYAQLSTTLPHDHEALAFERARLEEQVAALFPGLEKSTAL